MSAAGAGTAPAVRAALVEFDRRFAAGDATALAGCFAQDADLLLHHREAIRGRSAIEAHWVALFAAYDTSAWTTQVTLLDAHRDSATAMAVYAETLVHRAGGPSQIVHGRLAFFLRRDRDGWRIAVVMNSHDRPVELVPAEPPAGTHESAEGGTP